MFESMTLLKKTKTKKPVKENIKMFKMKITVSSTKRSDIECFYEKVCLVVQVVHYFMVVISLLSMELLSSAVLFDFFS